MAFACCQQPSSSSWVCTCSACIIDYIKNRNSWKPKQKPNWDWDWKMWVSAANATHIYFWVVDHDLWSHQSGRGWVLWFVNYYLTIYYSTMPSMHNHDCNNFIATVTIYHLQLISTSIVSWFIHTIAFFYHVDYSQCMYTRVRCLARRKHFPACYAKWPLKMKFCEVVKWIPSNRML